MVGVLLFLAVGAIQWFTDDRSEVDYSFFDAQVRAHNVKTIDVQGAIANGEFVTAPLVPPVSDADKGAKSSSKTESTAAKQPVRLSSKFWVTLPSENVDSAMVRGWQDAGVKAIGFDRPKNYGDMLILVWLGLLVFMVLGGWNMARRARDQMLGGGMISGVMKSPARRYSSDTKRTTFNDVAGLGNVKKDLQEIVDYLRDPTKFQKLGARVPKGVLLMGPPGTGKTLLAKAVAGEAFVPFFSINGSEFIQLFVGVGAGRVRDMFQTAQAAAPAILFIDEIDAVGRQRGAGLGGGHDEREQTLNQILSEMDGFSPTTTVIVLAATNRPDVLDPALLRPGRFDRHIAVDRPTLQGRRQLFDVHSRGVPLAKDVDFDRLARATIGLTGADIRNLVNEAALWAARQEQSEVHMNDFEYARDKVLMGAAREDVLSSDEKLITAYHEAGHALLAWLTPGCDRVHKVTILPRGRALGVTQLVPEEERFNISQHDLQARLAMLLAGRAAEKSRFDQFSAGAESDLQQATRLARRMVTHWGMSDRLGPVAYHNGEDHPFLGREITQHERHFSEHTAQVIDEEVEKILHAAEDLSKRTIDAHSDKLSALAEALLEREVIDDQEIAELIGPSVNESRERSVAVGPSEAMPIGE
ncbi:MAG TPA: ATP-dependent zinc metalloprotease FtsH [Lacipirellulaceae bacterium]|jgi:cell division protease FtsH|nr:ATP-dependent zinc metalloprotease FtsH [Lacipirellulaceae bacterium]